MSRRAIRCTASVEKAHGPKSSARAAAPRPVSIPRPGALLLLPLAVHRAVLALSGSACPRVVRVRVRVWVRVRVGVGVRVRVRVRVMARRV